MAVEVGAEFDTYDELTNAIRVYEAKNFVNLIIRDTRKVEAAAKRNQRKQYNPAIKYSDISYCCTYGGKKYISHSTGKRNHKTIKQACPFSLKVRATVDGQRLFVREMCTNHNHQLSEADFRLHPKQRKLDIGSQEEIANLLSMEPDKKLLREKLMQITGKVILMKDIHNIKTRLLTPKIKPKDFKEECVEKNKAANSSGNFRMGNPKLDATKLETLIPEESHEENQIPISQVASSHIDSSHQSLIFHQAEEQLGSDLQNCYSENQIYQQQPSGVYVSVQTFHPGQVFSVASQPFQPLDVVVQDTQQIDPHLRNPQHFQEWGTLEEVNPENVHEQTYQNVTSFSYTDQQHSTYHSQPQTQQTHITTSPSPQPVVLHKNTNIPQTEHQAKVPCHQEKRSKRNQLQQINRGKKRKKSADQIDKEKIIKRYIQQATVNLFFNERLKSPELECGPKSKTDFYVKIDRDSFQKVQSSVFLDSLAKCVLQSCPPAHSATGSKFLKVIKPGIITTIMSEGQTEKKFHDMLKPLSWLFGKWQSTEGKGIYPNITDFTYAEEAVFEPVGMKPVVEYRLFSWKTDNNIPMHREQGYIRVKPNTNHIAFVGAHSMGVVEIQEGEVSGQELTVESKSIGRASFNIPPEVKLVRRNLKRNGNELEQVIHMQTDRTELTEHLRITFKKVE